MKVTRVGSKLLLTVSDEEVATIVAHLDVVLNDGQIDDVVLMERNRRIANCLRPELSAKPSLPHFKDFTRDLEAVLLTEALAADRNLSRAAKTLGFKHHQSLISLLNSRRHQGLREAIGLAPAKTRHRPLRNQKTGERVTPARGQRRGPKMHVASATELAAQ